MKAESGENRITGRKRRVISIGFLILLVLIWELLSALIARPFLLPSPSAVFQSLWEHREEIFLTHLPATFGVVLAGGLLAVLLGAAFGEPVVQFAFGLGECGSGEQHDEGRKK